MWKRGYRHRPGFPSFRLPSHSQVNTSRHAALSPEISEAVWLHSLPPPVYPGPRFVFFKECRHGKIHQCVLHLPARGLVLGWHIETLLLPRQVLVSKMLWFSPRKSLHQRTFFAIKEIVPLNIEEALPCGTLLQNMVCFLCFLFQGHGSDVMIRLGMEGCISPIGKTPCSHMHGALHDPWFSPQQRILCL